MSARRILAIDGPAGAGKSTTSKAVARRLGLALLDTGAMYRSVTLACLRADVPIDDAAQCGAIAQRIVIDNFEGVTTLDGEDVTAAIRTPDVTRAVSTVSAHPSVRATLVGHQRRWAATHGSGVVEGRDIGTVVFPEAECKIYLIASSAARAQRRQRDEAAAGREVELASLTADIDRRDAEDSQRSVSPLRQPDDAIVIDTSDRTIDDVVTQIVDAYEHIVRPGGGTANGANENLGHRSEASG